MDTYTTVHIEDYCSGYLSFLVLGLLGFLGSSGSGSVVRFVSFRFVHISIFSFVGIPLVDVLALFGFELRVRVLLNHPHPIIPNLNPFSYLLFSSCLVHPISFSQISASPSIFPTLPTPQEASPQEAFPKQTSHNSTPNPIHSPLHIRPDKIPIRPALRKLVDLLRRENSSVPLIIRDDSREFFRL